MTANGKIKKYKLVAPDGGWGYLISLSAILNFSTTTSLVTSFGMLFNDFMIEIGISSTGVTFLTGMNSMSVAIAGFLTNPLLKIMSLRKLAFVMVLVFDIGVFGLVFANSVFQFFVCQAVLQGLGLGVLFNLTYTLMNDYFVEKRLFALSLVQTIVAVIALLTPMFLEWSLRNYGFRGTMLIITGLTMQNIFSVTLMQPVEWHMKRVEITPETEKQLLINETEHKENDSQNHTIDPENGKHEKGTFDVFPETKKSTGLMTMIHSVIDFSVCKELIKSCVSIGTSLSSFSDFAYLFMLPQALYAINWDKRTVAFALSLYSFGDLATRVVLLCGSKWFKNIGSQEMMIGGLVILLISRLVMEWTNNMIVEMICITFMGVAHCTINILMVLIVSETVSPEKFTSAIGFVLLLTGVTYIVLGPAIGAVRDITESYSVAFYLLTSLIAIVIIFWTIELIYKKKKNKREDYKSKKLNKS